jgi:hypothetical protein
MQLKKIEILKIKNKKILKQQNPHHTPPFGSRSMLFIAFPPLHPSLHPLLSFHLSLNNLLQAMVEGYW